MPVYPDYKYDAMVRYLSLQKSGETPMWGFDPIFVKYSDNVRELNKSDSTLASSCSLKQNFKHIACKFDLSEDGKSLMRNGKPVLREGEYEEVLSRFHDQADHPGMLILRSKILAHYANVSYERIDNYVRNCEVCKLRSKKKAMPVRRARSSRKKKQKPLKQATARSKSEKAKTSSLVCYAIRLHPGEEIKSSLQRFVKTNNLQAAFILSCVGSIRRCTLRMADSVSMLELNNNHEIVSLTGTLSAGGHLHASLSDENGKVIGGHVMGNMEVFTTAEIVIGNMPSFKFQRVMDCDTSYKELQIDQVEINGMQS